MVTYQIEAEFTEDGKMIADAPIDILPGKHIIIISLQEVEILKTPEVEEKPLRPKQPFPSRVSIRELIKTAEDLPQSERPWPFRDHDTGVADPNYRLRREDMYDGERG